MTFTGLKIVITANGEGSRMRGISPRAKHLLYYGGKRICEAIRDAFSAYGPVYILTHYEFPYEGMEWIKCEPTKTRKETLKALRGWENVLIVDCDIIPLGITPELMRYVMESAADCIWSFQSDNPKYGGLAMDESGRLTYAKEHDAGATLRASGAYFLKDVSATLDKMEDPNGLAAAMIGAALIQENTFVRIGDVEDYLNAITSDSTRNKKNT